MIRFHRSPLASGEHAKVRAESDAPRAGRTRRSLFRWACAGIAALWLGCSAAPSLHAAESATAQPTPPGAEERLTEVRSEILLNGIWQWQPAAGPAAQSPSAQSWGLIRVPGAWGGGIWGGYSNAAPGGRLPGVVQAGKGGGWNAWNASLVGGWYERTVSVPTHWAGSAVLVDFDRLGTRAKVFLDGRQAGEISYLGGSVDLTPLVRPGTSQTLRVLAEYRDPGEEGIDFMGVGQNVATRRQPNHVRGLIGDVVLRRLPARGPRITDLFIRTSVRKGRIDLDLDLQGVEPGTKLAVTAVVRSPEDRAELRRFTANADTVAPGPGCAPGSSAMIRTVGWEWKDARVWDLDDPYLHRLEVQLRKDGTAPDSPPADAFAHTFGFREFWTEGRDFFLNGTKIRLRPAGGHDSQIPSPETAEAYLKRIRADGRNLMEIWPEPKAYGPRVQDRVWAEAADRLGVLLAAPAMRINEFTWGPGYRPIWDSPQGRAAWEPAFRQDWRRLRNHPSIVLAILSGNLGGHFHDQDPRWLGRADRPPVFAGVKPNYAAQADADAVFAAFDPTRPWFHHQGGEFGSVFTVNHYLNFIPLQEREEWLTEWARSGDMPYMAVEFGTPFNASFLRGRDGFGNSIGTEPFLAEYAAIYFGPEAYSRQGRAYLQAVRNRFEKPDPVTGGRWASWQGSRELNFDALFQDVQELFIKRTWRAWRMEGVSGGMIPWDDGYAFEKMDVGEVVHNASPVRRGWFRASVDKTLLATESSEAAGWKPSPAGRAFQAVNGPTLAFWAGLAERPHAKALHLRAGEAASRQFVLINDGRRPAAFQLRWRLEGGEGTILAHGELDGTLAPAEIRRELIRVKPDVKPGPGESLPVAWFLEAEIAGTAHTDRVDGRIYGPPAAEALSGIVLHDPAGRTAAMLKEARIPSKPLDTALPPDGLLVIGRGAYSARPPAQPVAEWVRSGGRLLLMAQEPGWVQDILRLRTTPAPARRLWPVPTTAFAGWFDALDLRDWNGEGTLLPPRPDHASSSQMPPRGWRWGNTGSVASLMVEKPHRAGWTPLLEGEWDLAYTPLAEVHLGAGRVTWCGLDLEDQAAADPAADRLLRRVLAHAARPVAAPRAGAAVYSGGERGARLLDALGIDYRNEPAPSSAAGLWIVEPEGGPDDAKLRAFAQGGGTVVVLPQADAARPGRLGARLRAEEGFAGDPAPAGAGLVHGLSASDLRLRTPRTTVLLDKAEGMVLHARGWFGERSEGKGRIVWLQADPMAFDLSREPYFKHSQWRLLRACTQVLANAGAVFAADKLVLEPQQLQRALAGPWRVKFTRELELRDWRNPDHKPHADPGISAEARPLLAAEADDAAWESFVLPANHPRFTEISGEAVWRRTVEVPESWAGRPATLHLPGIKSFDTVFVNGREVGSTHKASHPGNANPWNLPRTYRIGAGILKPGTNTVAIRQFCPDREGGILGPPESMRIELLVSGPERLRFYADNWNPDAKYGDDPYRYYRW